MIKRSCTVQYICTSHSVHLYCTLYSTIEREEKFKLFRFELIIQHIKSQKKTKNQLSRCSNYPKRIFHISRCRVLHCTVLFFRFASLRSQVRTLSAFALVTAAAAFGSSDAGGVASRLLPLCARAIERLKRLRRRRKLPFSNCITEMGCCCYSIGRYVSTVHTVHTFLSYIS